MPEKKIEEKLYLPEIANWTHDRIPWVREKFKNPKKLEDHLSRPENEHLYYTLLGFYFRTKKPGFPITGEKINEIKKRIEESLNK